MLSDKSNNDENFSGKKGKPTDASGERSLPRSNAKKEKPGATTMKRLRAIMKPAALKRQPSLHSEGSKTVGGRKRGLSNLLLKAFRSQSIEGKTVGGLKFSDLSFRILEEDDNFMIPLPEKPDICTKDILDDSYLEISSAEPSDEEEDRDEADPIALVSESDILVNLAKMKQLFRMKQQERDQREDITSTGTEKKREAEGKEAKDVEKSL